LIEEDRDDIKKPIKRWVCAPLRRLQEDQLPEDRIKLTDSHLAGWERKKTE